MTIPSRILPLRPPGPELSPPQIVSTDGRDQGAFRRQCGGGRTLFGALTPLGYVAVAIVVAAIGVLIGWEAPV